MLSCKVKALKVVRLCIKKKKSRNMCKETCSECIQNKSLAAVNSFNPRRGIMSKSELFQKPIFGS